MAYVAVSAEGASVSKRELRTLAHRLARSERNELRVTARALDKLASGEVVAKPHHTGDFDPWRCAACLPALWVAYAIGVAFPDVYAADFDLRFGCLLGLSGENLELALDAGRQEKPTPDATQELLVLADQHRAELDTVRAELEPGCWHRDSRGWLFRDFDHGPPLDPEVDALIAEVAAGHAVEVDRCIAGHSHGCDRDGHKFITADRSLLQEIRYGSDPRKARAARRTALKQGFQSSWL
jgi:hypothetical protein